MLSRLGGLRVTCARSLRSVTGAPARSSRSGARQLRQRCVHSAAVVQRQGEEEPRVRYEEIDEAEAAALEHLGNVVTARENHYLPHTTNYSREAVRPPAKVVQSITDLLVGRNTALIKKHHAALHDELKARWKAQLNAMLKSRKETGEGRAPPASPVLYGPVQTVAYATHQLLPLFGVALRVLGQSADNLPSFRPSSMLDYGGGPGTAVLAAREVFPSMRDVVYVDPSRSMMQVAEHMLSDFPYVMYRRSMAEVQRFHRGKQYDLVTCHYTLSELPTDEERAAAVQELWEAVAPGGLLVLLDRGNGWGFHCVQSARDTLLEQASLQANSHRFSEGAAVGDGSRPPQTTACVVAPCAHAKKCPMHAKSWCHFAQATFAHRNSGNTRNKQPSYMPVRNERFSYVVLRKATAEQLHHHPPSQRAYDGPLPVTRVDEVPGEVPADLEQRLSSESVWLVPPMVAGEKGAAAAAYEGAGLEEAEVDELMRERVQAWAEAGLDEEDVGDSDDVISPFDVDVAGGEQAEAGSEGWEAEPELGELDELDEALAEDAWAAVKEGKPGAGRWSRIVRSPLLGGKHVTLDLCTPEGTLERRVPSKRKLKPTPGAYRAARRAQWGALWPDWIARKATPEEKEQRRLESQMRRLAKKKAFAAQAAEERGSAAE